MPKAKFFKGFCTGMLAVISSIRIVHHTQNLVLFQYYNIVEILITGSLVILMIWLISTEEEFLWKRREAAATKQDATAIRETLADIKERLQKLEEAIVS